MYKHDDNNVGFSHDYTRNINSDALSNEQLLIESKIREKESKFIEKMDKKVLEEKKMLHEFKHQKKSLDDNNIKSNIESKHKENINQIKQIND